MQMQSTEQQPPVQVAVTPDETVQFLVDASLFKHHNCLRDIQNILVHGFKKREKIYQAEYGTGFHKFAQEYRTTGNVTLGSVAAVKHYSSKDIQEIIPADDFRTPAHLYNVCTGYAAKYDWRNDRIQPAKGQETGKPALEAKFKLPYLKKDKVEILVCGTIDMIGFDYSEAVVMDYKTTAVWNAEEYLRGYETSPQLMMYKYIVERVANEIFPDTMRLFKDVGCVVDGVFLRKPTEKNPVFAEYKRSQVFHYTPEQMDEFKLLLDRFCYNLLMLVGTTKPWPRNFTCCDFGYKSEENPMGGCPFRKACAAPDFETEWDYLQRDFVQAHYNPELFQT